jgi:tetratricopeptide (TPR) repeat protein
VGISEVNHALELDPEFAAAWSLKAILLLQQYWFYDTNIATRDAAWEAIQQGRAIDPKLPELDLAEGYFHYWGFRDYEKALPFMERAAETMTNNTRAHVGKAYVLRRMGDWEGTLAALKRSNELDPRIGRNYTDIAETLNKLHHFEDAKLWMQNGQALDSDDPYNFSILAEINLLSSGDVKNFARYSRLYPAPNPETQLNIWLGSLYLGKYDTALQDVKDWPERYLESKDFHVTQPMLLGLTYLYSGDTDAARPLLLEAKLALETLLERHPESYPINRSLCTITGGLGELSNAQQYCRDSLATAPGDAFLAGDFKFFAATGLALAGDSQAALELLVAMLDGNVGFNIYPIIYHPAFDGIRENPAYIELLDKYGPPDNE